MLVLSECLPTIKRVVLHYDKINVRAARRFNQRQLELLQANAVKLGAWRSKYLYHHSDHRYSRLGYTIVCPNHEAQRFIDDLSPHEFTINSVELALNLIVDEYSKLQLQDLFNQCFVQPWHQQDVKHWDNMGTGTATGTATGKHGFCFVWYCDEECKVEHEEHCFHIEARCQGLPVLRRIGFDKLCTFDPMPFWHKYLNNLYEVDLQRLGRYHLNRITGQRRQKPLLQGPFRYNVDHAYGCVIYRGCYYDRCQDEMSSPGAQFLVDGYGRGPFMRRLDTLLIVNIEKSLRLLEPIECAAEYSANNATNLVLGP
jgi:hypothetical protein